MLTKTKTQPPSSHHLPMSFIKYHVKTAMPHAAVKHVAHFTSDSQNTNDSPNNSKSFTSTDLQYTSAVAHHAHTTGHTIDFKSTHILSSLTKSSQLDLIEHAAIIIICPSLNRLHSAPNINNQWTDLLPTIKNSFRPRLAYPQ